MKVIDLNNSEKLDIANETVSNFDALAGANIVAQNIQMAQAQNANLTEKEKQDLLKAGIGLAGTLASGISQSRAGQTCKKPLFPENPLNRSAWQSYRDCVANEEREKQRQFELEMSKKQSQETFLGMPKGVGIAVTVIGGLALIGTIVYIAVKK